MRRGEGFEPSVRLLAQRFSRPPHSTTLAPLLVEGEKLGRFRKGSNVHVIKKRRRTRVFAEGRISGPKQPELRSGQHIGEDSGRGK